MICLASRCRKVQQQHSSTRSKQKHIMVPLAAAIWSMYDLKAQLTASWNQFAVSVHKKHKKEVSQHPAILTKQANGQYEI